MNKKELMKLIDKNGLKPTEFILYGMGFELSEIKKMFDSVKGNYEFDGWNDCIKELECYKGV